MICPFCDLESNTRQEIILENDLCLFLQEPQEVLIGSGIIIPKEHRESVFDLTEKEWQATFSLLQLAKEIIDEKYKPNGYNIGWNIGSVAGQEVFHVHLHIIPRYTDEPLAGKGIRYWFKQLSNKRQIRSAG
ncbi:MAG: HIT domain-containing protein [Anaerolineales bacterium]|nr:HIT domain-containing protein [Anaerolineales bacterium]